VNIIDSITITAVFSEPANPPSATDTSLFLIDQNIGNPSSASISSSDLSVVVLQLAQPLQKGLVYSLTVAGVTDCAGNTIGDKNIARFGIPEPADSLDVLINEVLYNPVTGGVDFVELYNHSNKIIDLKSLLLARTDADGTIMTVSTIISAGYLLFPEEYVALTSNPDLIKSQYYTPNPDNFIKVTLPALPDNEGGVTLLTQVGKIIDQLYYYDDWEFALIDDHNGISLERISFEAPTPDKNNWHSAATTVRATPAYKNSQVGGGSAIAGEIFVEPEVFSPDGDGYKDFLQIVYHFKSPGFVANITIFDANGRPVRMLLQNELLSQEGRLQWDGTIEDGSKARIGIYIIYFEAFNLSGEVLKKKMKCVVGGNL